MQHEQAHRSQGASVAGSAAPPFGPWGTDGLGTSAARRARLQIHPSAGPNNSLCYFPRATGGYLPVLRNAVVIQLARYVPWLPVKRMLYQLLGMRVGSHASVGLMVMFDIFFPQD